MLSFIRILLIAIRPPIPNEPSKEGTDPNLAYAYAPLTSETPDSYRMGQYSHKTERSSGEVREERALLHLLLQLVYVTTR